MPDASIVLYVLMAVGATAQQHKKCVTPAQLTLRGMEINHKYDSIRRFFIGYDATNRRKVMFEEEREANPGRRLHEYLVLSAQNIEYDINLQTKECIRSVPHKWHDYGIPTNATFENEYYIGGPGEEVFVEEWSDRISSTTRETWLGSFSKINCYPISAVIIGPESTTNDTITAHYYDVVSGLPNPNDFIPPPECKNASSGASTRPHYL